MNDHKIGSTLMKTKDGDVHLAYLGKHYEINGCVHFHLIYIHKEAE
ncbi:hypothetical protein AAAC51_28150 [Priestia megaterium]